MHWIIKQFTERALPCVINTHDPYQGRRDPLSEREYYFLRCKQTLVLTGCTFLNLSSGNNVSREYGAASLPVDECTAVVYIQYSHVEFVRLIEACSKIGNILLFHFFCHLFWVCLLLVSAFREVLEMVLASFWSHDCNRKKARQLSIR